MTGRLDPPDHYDQARRGIWAAAIDRLTAAGKVFAADPVLLDTYVEAVASHRQATRLVSQTNVLITRGDRAVENPALAVQRRTADTIARLTRALGLGKAPVQTALAGSPMRGDQARWCEEHARPECRHLRKDRTDCHGFHLIAGTGSCRMHVGMSIGEARRAGQVALTRVYGEPLDVTPIEGLLDEVRWSAGHVAALRTLVSQIEQEEDQAREGPARPGGGPLWWGTTKVVTRDGAEAERTEQAVPHVIVQAYKEERRHFLEAAKAAVAAGAQQEMVDAARAVGADVGRLIDAVLDAIGLDEGQRARVPQVVPGVLRAWQPGGGQP